VGGRAALYHLSWFATSLQAAIPPRRRSQFAAEPLHLEGPMSSARFAWRSRLAATACVLGLMCLSGADATAQIVPPIVIKCPDDVRIECDESTAPENTGQARVIGGHCPSGQVYVAYTDSIVPGDCTQEMTIHRNWVATDDCDNEAWCTQVIEVEDTTPPVLECPADVTIACGEPTGPEYLGFATATDNCVAEPVVTYVDEEIVVDCAEGERGDGKQVVRIIRRGWTGTDQLQGPAGRGERTCGNETTCIQIITIVDQISPEITCPPDITIECDESTDPENTGFATATDGCPFGEIEITFTDEIIPGDCVQEMTINRTWRAVDQCLNEATCLQVITVEDRTAPEIICPADIAIQCDESTDPENTGFATGFDNCIGENVVFTFEDSVEVLGCDVPRVARAAVAPWAQAALARAAGEGKNIERIIRRGWTGTDQLQEPNGRGQLTCGNETTCVQIITVLCCPPGGDLFCTLTQGFYGNTGQWNGEGSLAVIEDLIDGSPLVVGRPGRSFEIPENAAQCVIDRLPSGSGAEALPAIGDDVLSHPSCQTTPPLPLQNDRFRNVLIGQVIALGLNVRLDPDLGGSELRAKFCTQGSLPGPDGLHGTGDDEIDPQSPITIATIPASVLSALSNLGLPATMDGLLALAQRGLAGNSTGGAALSKINEAVATINCAFDECRFLVDCPGGNTGRDWPTGTTACGGESITVWEMTGGDGDEEAATAGVDGMGSPPVQFQLAQNQPNPFHPRTRFTFALPAAGSWTLDICNVAGQIVRRFSGTVGEATAGLELEWDGRTNRGAMATPGVYLYRLQSGAHSATRKMILLK
jgi:hypothetical protein